MCILWFFDPLEVLLWFPDLAVRNVCVGNTAMMSYWISWIIHANNLVLDVHFSAFTISFSLSVVLTERWLGFAVYFSNF